MYNKIDLSNVKVGDKVLTGNSIVEFGPGEFFEVTKVDGRFIYGRMSPKLLEKEGYDSYEIKWNMEGVEIPDGWEDESIWSVLEEFGECWSITKVLD